mmetsp:Transcript_56147/g.130735  ORF Transcript_56147/g.130735 Transcript_56147/m.130735 type:complete len:281 (+) Transcript_56147:515-1357(+)
MAKIGAIQRHALRWIRVEELQHRIVQLTGHHEEGGASVYDGPATVRASHRAVANGHTGELQPPHGRVCDGEPRDSALFDVGIVVPDEPPWRAWLPAQARREDRYAQLLEQRRLRLRKRHLLLRLRLQPPDLCGHRQFLLLVPFDYVLQILELRLGHLLWFAGWPQTNDGIETCVRQKLHLTLLCEPQCLVRSFEWPEGNGVIAIAGQASTAAIRMSLLTLPQSVRSAVGLVVVPRDAAARAPCAEDNQLKGAGVQNAFVRLPANVKVTIVLQVHQVAKLL